MYLEYCNYHKYITDYSKELSEIFKAIDKGINGVAVPVHLARELREFMPEGITLACPIDYPCGYSSTKVREHMVLDAIKSGANTIDYVPNQYLLRSKFKVLSNEIQTINSIANEHGADVRVFLDYHNVGNVVSLARIYKKLGLDTGFVTTGYHHDDFYDNIINSKLIEKKTDMKIIFNGYMWTSEQLGIILKANIYGIRIYNLSIWCNILV